MRICSPPQLPYTTSLPRAGSCPSCIANGRSLHQGSWPTWQRSISTDARQRCEQLPIAIPKADVEKRSHLSPETTELHPPGYLVLSSEPPPERIVRVMSNILDASSNIAAELGCASVLCGLTSDDAELGDVGVVDYLGELDGKDVAGLGSQLASKLGLTPDSVSSRSARDMYSIHVSARRQASIDSSPPSSTRLLNRRQSHGISSERLAVFPGWAREPARSVLQCIA